MRWRTSVAEDRSPPSADCSTDVPPPRSIHPRWHLRSARARRRTAQDHRDRPNPAERPRVGARGDAPGDGAALARRSARARRSDRRSASLDRQALALGGRMVRSGSPPNRAGIPRTGPSQRLQGIPQIDQPRSRSKARDVREIIGRLRSAITDPWPRNLRGALRIDRGVLAAGRPARRHNRAACTELGRLAWAGCWRQHR